MKYRLVRFMGVYTIRRGHFGKYGNWELVNNASGVRLPCHYPLHVLDHLYRY